MHSQPPSPTYRNEKYLQKLRNTQFFKMLQMKSQATQFSPPQRLAPLATFGPSPRWIAPPRKKFWLQA